MIAKTLILYTAVALTTSAELPNSYNYAAPDSGFTAPAAPGGGGSSGGGHAGSGGGHAGSGGGQGGGGSFQGQAGGFRGPQGGSRGEGFDGSSGTQRGGGVEAGGSRVTYNTQYQPSGPIIPILRDDRQGPDQYGNYNFQFETGNGISRHEQGAPGPNGAVITQGGWSFTFPDGTPAVFNFVADENGYRVESDLIPTPHPLPAHALAQIQFAEQQKAAGIPFDDGTYRGEGSSGRYSGPSSGSGRVGGSSAGGLGSASTTREFGASLARNTGSSSGGFTGASSTVSGDYGASPSGSAGGFGGASAGGFGGASVGGFPGASTAGNIGGDYSADSSGVLVRNPGSPSEGAGAPGVHGSSSRPALRPQPVSTPSRVYGTP